MSDNQCDPFEALIEGISTSGDPHRLALQFCAFLAVLAFVVSTASDNFSQVDKVWSIVPFLYAWMAACDGRTVLMATLATIWGARLTYNFHRRGGYTWPPWEGEEDYRWAVIRSGGFVQVLTNPVAWTLFNLVFISAYQNLLLWLIASPSFVAWVVANSPSCTSAPLDMWGLDGVATSIFLFFVAVEAIADNQQLAFQTEKYRRKAAGEDLTEDFKHGFCRSGLFSVLRKPNYAAEQSIWITYYLFSVAAMGGTLWNWSVCGFVLLTMLFQLSGWFTERITLKKYPKYSEYQREVPLYIPVIPLVLRAVTGRSTKGRKQK